ncbi:ATP-binding protein [Streptomyces europaeiscabiei]|uniref:ATP-binding protein n=1 Tax=Streptomyces europaeiscabiei TaxID=146819 RepID=A0AAJ2UJX1_9ACTN|nr:ATP-binding protein [Streptomyces europaeiscabiei]MDX3129210.1 ATP-binding protein [Streptomyces europaeiscabiei]
MDEAAHDNGTLQDSALVKSSAVYDGSPGDIARGRAMARAFLVHLQSVRHLPVSTRAMSAVQLVVSELLTNACKYAPGPCLLDLEVSGGSVQVTVWDSDPRLPVPAAAEPSRVGQHGLEIVMAVCQSYEVHREAVGKSTTAAVMLADDAGGRPGRT